MSTQMMKLQLDNLGKVIQALTGHYRVAEQSAYLCNGGKFEQKIW